MEIPAEHVRAITYFREASSRNMTTHDRSGMPALCARAPVLTRPSINKQTSLWRKGQHGKV